MHRLYKATSMCFFPFLSCKGQIVIPIECSCLSYRRHLTPLDFKALSEEYHNPALRDLQFWRWERQPHRMLLRIALRTWKANRASTSTSLAGGCGGRVAVSRLHFFLFPKVCFIMTIVYQENTLKMTNAKVTWKPAELFWSLNKHLIFFNRRVFECCRQIFIQTNVCRWRGRKGLICK